MLQDRLLCERYVRHLDLLIDLAAANENEIANIRNFASWLNFTLLCFQTLAVTLQTSGNAICFQFFVSCDKRARWKSSPARQHMGYCRSFSSNRVAQRARKC